MIAMGRMIGQLSWEIEKMIGRRRIHDDAEIEKSDLFNCFGCAISDPSIIKGVSWFSVEQVGRMQDRLGTPFLHPIKEWKNHLIWGGSNSYDQYLIADRTLQEHLDANFTNLTSPVILTSLDTLNNFTITATKFSVRLAMEFRRWAGYDQTFLMLDPSGRRLVALNDELGYTLVCRDPELHPDPFEGITDLLLVDMFHRDVLEFGKNNIEIGLFEHISKDILPFVEERAWVRKEVE